MTRGQIRLIDKDGNMWTSTEFNGGMMLDTYGQEIIDGFQNVNSIDEWIKFVTDFNDKNFKYKEEVIYYKMDENEERENINFGCDNLYDLTTYHYLSDYMYWLNLSGNDIEVKCNNGIIRINQDAICMFNYDNFVENIYCDAGFIEAEDSYDFCEEEDNEPDLEYIAEQIKEGITSGICDDYEWSINIERY